MNLMIIAISPLRLLTRIVLLSTIVLGSFCFNCQAQTCPAYYTDKVESTPDLPQTDPEAGFIEGGQIYCGPVAVSNSLMWLADHGFDKLRPKAETEKQSQVAMVKLLAARDRMDTDDNGTGVGSVLQGVGKYVDESGYHCQTLEYQGWRPVNIDCRRTARIPSLYWMQKIISNPAGAVWLNIGFYVYDKDFLTYKRRDGHWVTVVGYGVDSKGATDPSVLILHDPSPRSGQTLSHDYCHLVKIEDDSKLAGDYDGLPRNARGYYIIRDGLHIMRKTSCAIIDSAVGLIIEE